MSSCRNRKITDAQKQFTDFLVLRQKEARWAGFQFTLFFINVIGISYANKYAVAIGKEPEFLNNCGALLGIVIVQIGKLICFNPLTKTILPEKN
jgi:hypothetical protein